MALSNTPRVLSGTQPSNGRIAGGVLYGLNGQTITGDANGAWAVAANGTNQNITLTPSGSGKTILSTVTDALNTINLGASAANGFLSWDASNLLLRAASSKGITFQVNAANEQTKYHSGGNWTFGTTTDSSNGRIQLATHTTSAGGISFGTRAAEVIHRSANDTLTCGSLWITPASTTTQAGLRAPHGAAPTAPVDGDIWTTTAGLFVRINGATVGPLS